MYYSIRKYYISKFVKSCHKYSSTIAYIRTYEGTDKINKLQNSKHVLQVCDVLDIFFGHL